LILATDQNLERFTSQSSVTASKTGVQGSSFPDATFLPASLLDSRLHGNDEKAGAVLRLSGEGGIHGLFATTIFRDTVFLISG
jgi:hypothetical protein